MNDAAGDEKYLGPERLLFELSMPFPQNTHGQLAMHGAKTLGPIQRFMVKAGGSFEDGRQPAAMLHLFSRSITDLVTGLQLLSHCYLQQAHSVIRPVQENCELLDLFAADADAARRWIESEEPGKEFSSRAVREQLGEKKPDEMYGYLSEIGPHPRLAGMQVAGGILQSDEGEKKGVLRIGPFWPEHPRTITAFFLPAHYALLLGFRTQHLTQLTTRVTMLDWLQTYRAVIEQAAQLAKDMRGALVEMGRGEGSEFLDTVYDEGLEKVDKILAEEKPRQPPTEDL